LLICSFAIRNSPFKQDLTSLTVADKMGLMNALSWVHLLAWRETEATT
jgi:hypothetical protein